MELYKSIKTLNSLLEKKERSKLLIVILLNVCVNLLEVMQIVSVYPLIAVMAKYDAVNNIPFLTNVFELFSVTKQHEQIILLVCVIFLVALLKALFSVISVAICSLIIADGNTRISSLLNRVYLYTPITLHLSRHSAESIRNIRSLGLMVFNASLPGVINLVNGTMAFIAIATLLLVFNPYATLSAGLFVSGMVLFQQMMFGKKLSKYASEKLELARVIQKQLYFSLEAIKETKLHNKQGYFDKLFRFNVEEEAKMTYWQYILIQTPAIYFELILMISICIVILIFISLSDGELILAELAVVVMAAYRLLPSVSKISTGLNNLRTGAPSVNIVANELNRYIKYLPKKSVSKPKNKLALRENIQLKNIEFAYPGSSVKSLRNVNLFIKRGERIGLVGNSGAGKSTLALILLGLLEPDSGQYLVDNIDIYKNIESWQDNLGFIPQNIVIADESVRKNIAFGFEEKEISDDLVWAALYKAQLAQHIKKLPKKLDSILGERGNKLSGGQVQRVGIARALYRNPDLIILDEATSALDSMTESKISEEIFKIDEDKTVLIIAHRLKTIEQCDRIIYMHDGSIKGVGTLKELIVRHKDFEELVLHSEFSATK